MKNFLDDQYIFDAVEKLTAELDASDYREEEVADKIYEMFKVDHIEAGVYTALWFFWTAYFSAGDWWLMDREITRETDYYCCVAWWFDFESYRSLKLTMKFLDEITNVLFKYDKISEWNTQTNDIKKE